MNSTKPLCLKCQSFYSSELCKGYCSVCFKDVHSAESSPIQFTPKDPVIEAQNLITQNEENTLKAEKPKQVTKH